MRKDSKQSTADVEVGAVYEGKVKRIVDFGAFVTILTGVDGLLHITEIANERIKIYDYFEEGETINVKVLDVDHETGRIQLSMKACIGAQPSDEGREIGGSTPQA